MRSRLLTGLLALVSLTSLPACQQSLNVPIVEIPATDSEKAPMAEVPRTAMRDSSKPAASIDRIAGKTAEPAAATEPYGEHKPVPVDPVKVNGPIFEGWTKPQLALVITGEQAGYLEPCGCAGLENQKGGLSRRFTLLKQLRDEGWPLVNLDLGGLARRAGAQEEIKFKTAVEALRAMDYKAIGWSPEDLRLPTGILLAHSSEPDGGPSRFISANVGLFELDPNSPARYRIIEAGGRKIGVTSVLGDDLQSQVKAEDVKLSKAEAALEPIAKRLETEADYRVLLSFAGPEESIRLAKRFPQFDCIVTAHGADEPPREPKHIEGSKQLLLELGHKGMYAVVLGFYDSGPEAIRYQRVPIDSRFADAPEMKALLTNYEDELHAMGWDGLGIRSAAHPNAGSPSDLSGKFVGSDACAKCHPTAFGIWQKSGHAKATATLTKLTPPRQFDAECVSCHVTGWKPQEFVPYESGFHDLETTPHLAGNGCENCHGPGGAHVAAEHGKSIIQRDAMRQAVRLTKATIEQSACIKCHDVDNSPKFQFSTYWPKIEHKGKK